MQRTQQPTIDGSSEGDERPGQESHDSGGRRLVTGDGGWRQKCRQSATRVAGGSGKEGDGKMGGGRATVTATATKRAMAGRLGGWQATKRDGNGDGTGDGNGEGEGGKSDGASETDSKVILMGHEIVKLLCPALVYSKGFF